MNNFAKCIGALIKIFIRLYQRFISPLMQPRCRFYPSCSCYATQCLDKYTLIRALLKISIRILKCNPFHAGGIDLP